MSTPSRASGFVVLATLFRPIGGWLSDHVTAVPVILTVLCVVGSFAIVVAFQPDIVVATVAFLIIAAALDTGKAPCSRSSGGVPRPIRSVV